MKHASLSGEQHTVTNRKAAKVEILPLTALNPGDAFLREETEKNRKSERWLILYATIALILVAILVVARLVFFR
jgi:hypothetical protein